MKEPARERPNKLTIDECKVVRNGDTIEIHLPFKQTDPTVTGQNINLVSYVTEEMLDDGLVILQEVTSKFSTEVSNDYVLPKISIGSKNRRY